MDSKRLRIVYMGTPEFSVAPLRALYEGGYSIVGVITMPDKPAGRGLHMQQSAVKQYALQVGLPVLQPEKLKDPDFIEALRALKPDLGIVIAFRMLPEAVWSMSRLGTFNLHASLLPQYRGAAPINWALIRGEHQTGVTTFMLNHEIDKGDLLCRLPVPVTEQDNAETLHDKLMAAGTDLVLETVEKIASGNIVPIPQPYVDPAQLHGAPKLFKGNCRIDWQSDAKTIYNLVRGLSPYPAAWSQMCRTDETPFAVKIFSVHIELTSVHVPPGSILSDGKTFLKVACNDGYLGIDELQMAGKKRMTAGEFLRGFRDIRSYTFD